MKVTISVGSVEVESRHWVTCPSRAAVTLSVSWAPGPGTKGSEVEPTCRLSYLTAPGLSPGHLPGGIDLERVPDREAIEYRGATTVVAPFFHPLRVRIELQPAFGHPLAHLVYVIPMSSARASTAIVLASLAAVAILVTTTFSTLRVTPAQTAAGIGATLLVPAALYVLRVAMKTFRANDLPLFGITHLIYRSVGACALTFAVLVGLVKQCMVVIHNDTEDEVVLELPWRDQKDVVSPGVRITVVPPSRDQLDLGLRGLLAESERERALCVMGIDDPAHACRDPKGALLDDWRVHPFSPKTLEIGCGRRWSKQLPAASVLPSGHEGILIDGDDVWLAPPSDSHCGRDEKATLWYRDGEAVHRVSFPWQPEQLESLEPLWISVLDDATARAFGLTLRSVREPAGDEPGGFRPETRILLSGSHDDDRGWPLMGLHGAPARLQLELGESLPLITDPLPLAAQLECIRGQGRGTRLRAVRLGHRGAVGWLERLVVSAKRGLSWGSTWTLTQSSSLDVAVPWICEAFPGEDPHKVSRQPFSADVVELHLGRRTGTAADPPQLVVPAHLLARHIEIHRTDEPTAAASRGGLMGTLECEVQARAEDLVVVGRVRLEDRRNGRVHGLRLRTEGASLGRWDPAGEPESPGEVWMCWREGFDGGRVEVTPVSDRGVDEDAIAGEWDETTVRLDPVKRTRCYRNQRTGRVYRSRPPGVKDRDLEPARQATLRELWEHHPDTHDCDAIWLFEGNHS